ncbi:hypothetical protein ID866_5869, partial [Astraeus odoratus]
SKYDGKFVDGRRPIKIEIIVDSDHDVPKPTAPATPSLLNRLGGVLASKSSPANAAPVPAPNHAPNNARAPAPPNSLAPRVAPRPVITSIPRRRQKKGPKRVKKSRAQLDQEMEDYRAEAVVDTVNGNGKLQR